jgi:hypothetical protein
MLVGNNGIAFRLVIIISHTPYVPPCRDAILSCRLAFFRLAQAIASGPRVAATEAKRFSRTTAAR